MNVSATRVPFAFFIGSVAVVAIIGCGGEEVEEGPPTVRPVRTMVVGGGVGGRLTFPGTVQAADRAEMAFRVAGPLIELPVNEGDEVAEGQLLARIDPRDFQIAGAEAEAAFNQAEAEAQRYQRLYERDAVPLADLELRQAQRDVARSRYEQAQANLRDTRMRAPFSGQIGVKYVENFEDVLAKQPILSLHNVSQVEIVINVPEQIMASVRGGTSTTITAAFDALPDVGFPVTVKEYAVNADPQTRTFAVTLAMSQPEELNVLPGMTALVTAEVMAVGGEGEAIPITIPAFAVFPDEAGNSHVWVVDEEMQTVHRRAVQVGSVTGADNIFVLGGLEPGERIAVAGIHQLQEGQKIRLMDN
jgi:RND family efflux transporter MFP subunit